jgi:hypothetical protein
MATCTHVGRELIDTGTEQRYAGRNRDGRPTDSDDVGRSLAQHRQKAQARSRGGHGDRRGR